MGNWADFIGLDDPFVLHARKYKDKPSGRKKSLIDKPLPAELREKEKKNFGERGGGR